MAYHRHQTLPYVVELTDDEAEDYSDKFFTFTVSLFVDGCFKANDRANSGLSVHATELEIATFLNASLTGVIQSVGPDRRVKDLAVPAAKTGMAAVRALTRALDAPRRSSMRSREETARFIEAQLNDKAQPIPAKSGWHYGRAELRQLLDFIYGGPPTNSNEALFVWVPPADEPPHRSPKAPAASSAAEGEPALTLSPAPVAKCRHCGRDKGQHRAETLNCPTGRGYGRSFIAGQTYEPRRARPKKPTPAAKS